MYKFLYLCNDSSSSSEHKIFDCKHVTLFRKQKVCHKIFDDDIIDDDYIGK